MTLVNSINFNAVKEQLREEMQFYVWSTNSTGFFVAEEETQKDSAHVHLFVVDNDLDKLLLTFVSEGTKQHAHVINVSDNPESDVNWEFEYQSATFKGDKIETALKRFGAKEADATSVQNTFSAVAVAIGL